MELQKNEPLADQQIVIEKIVRKDKQGCPIIKGQKGHKITFIDDVITGKQIHNIVVVECWKQFNYPSPEPDAPDECCMLI